MPIQLYIQHVKLVNMPTFFLLWVKHLPLQTPLFNVEQFQILILELEKKVAGSQGLFKKKIYIDAMQIRILKNLG